MQAWQFASTAFEVPHLTVDNSDLNTVSHSLNQSKLRECGYFENEGLARVWARSRYVVVVSCNPQTISWL